MSEPTTPPLPDDDKPDPVSLVAPYIVESLLLGGICSPQTDEVSIVAQHVDHQL